ncbi:MAG: HD domain-containing protein [Bacteroidales bacterium]|nr:HD domain-containing protein [Bacteroidales bacterium]
MSIEKKKILNDPVYGFINIPKGAAFNVIEHPYFQRLRRIKQLGLTYYVYPGAIHSRFQHTLGATHLMTLALDTLISKGIEISEDEYRGAVLAILLHDIGHGPFSHSLEKTIVGGISHEKISLELMNFFNQQLEGRLEQAISIFRDKHKKHFLHQLVSSQLDVDRLDYLLRDSFFTGVSEGIVGSDRILKMLQVHENKLVVESKGIYSVEKFLIARRLMYWQVYLHKTVIGAEQLLLKVLQRAKYLADQKEDLFATPALKFFLYNHLSQSDLHFLTDVNIGNKKASVLELFTELDDNDLLAAIKVWRNHKDSILSFLSRSLIDRQFFHVELQNQAFNSEEIDRVNQKVKAYFNINNRDLEYFVMTGTIRNNAYSRFDDRINIIQKNKQLVDIADASDILDLSALSKVIEKRFLLYPKQVI